MEKIPENEQLFILNEENTLINKQFLYSLFKKYKLKHRLNNIKLFIEATTHPSYCVYKTLQKQNQKEIFMIPIGDPTKAVPLQETTYERLEFLGDSVIHCILADYLFHRYEDQYEGFMTKLRTKLENTTMLSKFSRTLGLEKYVLVSRYIEANDGRAKNDHILEDIFEAFIGALYNDTLTDENCNKTNYNQCRKLVCSLIESEVDISELLYNETNHKDLLLQYAHKMKWPDPIYGNMKVISSNRNKKLTNDQPYYEMFVKISGSIVGTGSGTSKRKGEQEAAKMALIGYRVIKEDVDSSEEEYEYEDEDEDDTNVKKV